MKFLARIFAHALARRLAYVLAAAALAWFGLGSARAATQCPSPVPRVCDQGQAYADALRQATEAAKPYCDSTGQTGAPVIEAVLSTSLYNPRYRCRAASGQLSGTYTAVGVEAAFFGDTCSARPNTYAGFVNTSVAASRCLNGCLYQVGNVIQQHRIDAAPNPSIFQTRGYWVPTGAVCGLDAPQVEPPKDNYCADLPMGHKLCRDDKGRNCVISGSTGRKYCPDEAGGPLNSTNDSRTENVTGSPEGPAPGTPPPEPQARPGENWSPTVNPSVTNITNNTTINNSINGNTGQPNTNPNDVAPGDGSPGNGSGGNTPGNPNNPNDEGEGDDESEGGAKLSGGLSCEVPPVCDVVDDAACKTGMIQWQLACDGAAEVGSAQDAAQIQVALLEASWDAEAQQYSDGAIQQYNEARAALASDVQENDELDFGLLDSSGFLGAGACPVTPSFTVGGQSFSVSFELLCSLLSQMGLFIEAMAYLVALKIMTRG